MSTDPTAATFEQDAQKALDQPSVATLQPLVSEVQPLVQAVPEIVKETKAGYKTTEFWLTIASGFSVATGLVPTPHDTKGYALLIVVAAYVIARGLAKKGIPSIEPSGVAIAPVVTEADIEEGAPPPAPE